MPSGTLACSQLIVSATLATGARRIVDLGIGTGKYGFLLREQTDLAQNRQRADWQLNIVGVEGYPAYVGDHQRAVYDDIVIGDFRDYVRDYEGPKYDAALAIDVIEHLPPADVVHFISRTLDIASVVLIATPKMYYPQAEEENDLERHHSWWPTRALRRLARETGAKISIARASGVNLAVISRDAPLPELDPPGWRGFVEQIKDVLIPELARYKRLRATGPTLLDLSG